MGILGAEISACRDLRRLEANALTYQEALRSAGSPFQGVPRVECFEVMVLMD